MEDKQKKDNEIELNKVFAIEPNTQIPEENSQPEQVENQGKKDGN